MSNVSTCLWFNGCAEQAALKYTALIPRSRIVSVLPFPPGLPPSGAPNGSRVMTVDFELDGVAYTGLNGGPQFQFTPAMSLVVQCDTQAEIDRLWSALSEGGTEGRCGWLTDSFGVSWQIIPRDLPKLLGGADAAGCRRAAQALLAMTKLDLSALQQAYRASSS